VADLSQAWGRHPPAELGCPAVRVVFLGVRGSVPVSEAEMLGVGGHTSCVAVAHRGVPPALVLDAGTGLRQLGPLLAGGPFRGTIVLGHLHWDHVIGLPFLPNLDRPDADVTVLVPRQGPGDDAEELLARFMSPPAFPIFATDLRGRWTIRFYDDGRFDVEGFHVLARDIPHKGGRTMGLRIADGSGAFAYLSDHAPHDFGPGDDGTGELHPAAMELARGVDVLVHDAQYTADELPARGAFGHAAAEYAARLGEAADVGRVLLFHHDPRRTDEDVAAICAKVAASATVPVDVASEGLAFDC
jgi:ribonuclease BN (tRNA processing enzyme)